MSDANLKPPTTTHEFWGPAIVLVLSTIVLVALWWSLERGEEKQLRTSTSITAELPLPLSSAPGAALYGSLDVLS